MRIIILKCVHFRLETENANLKITVKMQARKIEQLQTNLLGTNLVSQSLNFHHTEKEYLFF